MGTATCASPRGPRPSRLEPQKPLLLPDASKSCPQLQAGMRSCAAQKEEQLTGGSVEPIQFTHYLLSELLKRAKTAA